MIFVYDSWSITMVKLHSNKINARVRTVLDAFICIRNYSIPKRALIVSPVN